MQQSTNPSHSQALRHAPRGTAPDARTDQSNPPSAGAPSESINVSINESIGELPTSRGFAALLAAYRASGGTARGDDVARLLEEHRMGDFVSLARHIAAREIFGFEWRGALWIPMFQFELRDLSIKPAASTVLAELGSGFDGWERAAWFAQPNCWLNYRRPADVVQSDLAEVVAAARTDRFIAIG